jgi:hypothetical protein
LLALFRALRWTRGGGGGRWPTCSRPDVSAYST